ncbi:MAG: prepilin-type N-terminal cleavage/methylation domain-containing protein [Terriglobales bacterium]
MTKHKSSKRRKTRKHKGFSLIELLIVVAIILIIAAIAIPNLLRSRIAANEASAVGSLRTLNTAEITYNMTYPSVGFACALNALAPTSGGALATSSAAGLIDANLASGTKSGYTFTVGNCTGTPKSNYQYAAAPVNPGTTGQRYFCTDSSGVIQYNASAAITTCGTGTTPI